VIGYRAVMAPATFKVDRRKTERSDVDEVAFISAAGSSTRCRVVNISSDGVAIDVPDSRYIPYRFQLMTERDRLVRNCRVVWIIENRIGVEFESLSEEVAQPDRQLLQYRSCC
jgi:hypothetical protein